MSSVLAYYQSLLKTFQLQPDDAQRQVAEQLAQLERALMRRAKYGFWRRSAMPKSLYIHGPVGGGKSMLMDILYAQCSSVPRRRVHFHGFMKDVHMQLHKWRTQANVAQRRDPVSPLAAKLAGEMDLLCFDEFYVNNIADAALLERLLRGLIKGGVTIVLTSNDAPDALYAGGLNRSRFLPCIDFIKQHFTVCMLHAQQDYRYRSPSPKSHWHRISSPQERARFEAYFQNLCAPHDSVEHIITYQQRAICFPQSVPGIGRIDFKNLCGLPLAAADYLLLAQHFHTLVLDNVPAFSIPRAENALRFITLIDVLYNARLRLIATSAHTLDGIWQGDISAQRPQFQDIHKRARSRLEEMSKPDWALTPAVVADTSPAPTLRPSV